MDEAFTYYQRAMEATHPDVVIANLDACLVLDPPPQIAMFAYRNIAGAIWEKFSFAQRSGKTISSEEFWWAQRASECLRRVVAIFGRLADSEQLDPEVTDCHENSKKFLHLRHNVWTVLQPGWRNARAGYEAACSIASPAMP